MTIEAPKRRYLLEEIYLTYKKVLYLTAYDMVRNHQVAEDIVHDSILRANDHLEKFSEIKSKKTQSYLVIIVKNLCRDYFKEDLVKGVHIRHLTPVEELVDLQDENKLIESGFLHREKMMEISELIDLIKPSYSEVIKLRYYDELTLDEIAELLGTTTNNVGVRINRGIKSIQKLYNERSEGNYKIKQQRKRA